MARVIANAMRSRQQPILAQIVPMRRCNLSCTYCNEYDKTSAPVPTEEMLARIDRLADLGTSLVDLSGGEPLLHPDLDILITRIRRRGMMGGLLTNGYLLSVARIARLNRAGLDRLQISIDNVLPDDVSVKSLKVLDKKLEWLAEHAHFDVNINTVVGNGIGQPEDALTIARRARELGFGTSVGVIHDAGGQIVPLDADRQRVHAAISSLGRSFYSHAHDQVFQKNLIAGRSNQWHCRAGSRYLYVCEDGLVHWCSQQRGTPGIPLAHVRSRRSRTGIPVRQIVRAALHRLVRASRVAPRRDSGDADRNARPDELDELGWIQSRRPPARVRQVVDLDVRDGASPPEVPPAGNARVPAGPVRSVRPEPPQDPGQDRETDPAGCCGQDESDSSWPLSCKEGISPKQGPGEHRRRGSNTETAHEHDGSHHLADVELTGGGEPSDGRGDQSHETVAAPNQDIRRPPESLCTHRTNCEAFRDRIAGRAIPGRNRGAAPPRQAGWVIFKRWSPPTPIRFRRPARATRRT